LIYLFVYIYIWRSEDIEQRNVINNGPILLKREGITNDELKDELKVRE